jgi:hypothetical protein
VLACAGWTCGKSEKGDRLRLADGAHYESSPADACRHDKLCYTTDSPNHTGKLRQTCSNYEMSKFQKQHVQLQREKFKQWAQGRGDDATRLTVKWLRNGILELSRAGIEQKPFDILRKCYCLALEQMDGENKPFKPIIH